MYHPCLFDADVHRCLASVRMGAVNVARGTGAVVVLDQNSSCRFRALLVQLVADNEAVEWC